MKKPKLLPIAFCTAVTVGLSACGGGGGSPETITDNIDDSGSSTEANAIAAAGLAFDIARNDTAATLDGSASSDPDGDALTYTWTQTAGTDVTGGVGVLTGVSPQFTAPAEVSTLLFDLTVNDGNGDSAAESVQVNILEHTGPSFYVNGDNGSDTTGDGSRNSPYASIAFALARIPAIQGTNYDIYVKTRNNAEYNESGATLTISVDTSLYGGYDANWVRDVNNNRTQISGHRHAVLFDNVNQDAWFSGFELTAADGDGNVPFNSSAISAETGSATLYIQDNAITSGNTDASASRNDSYGLRLVDISAVRVLRNTIIAANAGNSTDTGSDGATGIRGKKGGDGRYGGDGGFDVSHVVHNFGGDGGLGGDRGGVNGEAGKRGWRSTGVHTGSLGGGEGGAGGYGFESTRAGRKGSPGSGGRGGNGGNGGRGDGAISNGYYLNQTAQNGRNGAHGRGGGGGGGGEGGAIVIGDRGGDGGGGGQGGTGGTGGVAGGSGGASIGILLSGITDTLIDNNTIISNNGGSGAAGGLGGIGGQGGDGGYGRAVSTLGDGADGGDGGGGGGGGDAGQGGAGAGGPSYTILVNSNMAPIISNNTLTAGNGGAPGPNVYRPNGDAYGGRGGSAGKGRSGYGGATATRGSPGRPAEGGWAYNIFDINTSDGLVPALGNNTFNSGTAGLRGRAADVNF